MIAGKSRAGSSPPAGHRVNPESPTPPRTGSPFNAQEQRRLAVIMFTDMVGYSALTQRDEALALELLEEHRRTVRPILAHHGGREIKTIGDAFLVEFASALAAMAGAVEIQRALRERNLAAPPGRQVHLRIGLHAGDVVYRENDVFGDGVNIAARIEPLAEAGGICVSEDVARQFRSNLDFHLKKLGAGELKNIALPVDIYRVVLPWQQPRPLDRFAFLLAKRSVRRGLLAAGTAAVLLALWLGTREDPAGPVNRLAVLPLENRSGDPREEYFADGLTEELISTLATIRDLSVIARTSVVKFKDARPDLAEIGRVLNVGSVLTGTVRIEGDLARINVDLVEVRTQKTVWSEVFTKPLKDVFAVQAAIALNVSEALKIELLSGEKTLLDRPAPATDAAYREYVLGRTQLGKRTGDEIVKAIGSFSRAIERDAGYAPAYAGLAECYTLAGVAGYGDLPREQAIELARSRAARAVALDDQLAEAHAALAYVKFRVDWDWAGAELEFKRALALKPGVAHTHELYALFLAIQKRLPEATAEMQRARQLDPLSPSVSNGLGRVLHFQRKADEAIAQFNRTLALDPNYAEAHFSLGLTYLLQKRYDDAAAAIQHAIQLSGNRQVMLAMLGLTQGLAGRKDEARRILDDLRAQARTADISPYYFALLAIGLGDFDEAFQRLNEAADKRDGIIIYLPVDPIADAIWPDPRFPALVQKLGLKP